MRRSWGTTEQRGCVIAAEKGTTHCWARKSTVQGEERDPKEQAAELIESCTLLQVSSNPTIHQ